MPQDLRVTAYIEKAAPFARPILTELRARLQRARPDLDEAIKWSMPFFVFDGAPIANMAAFKTHAAFGFWRREAAGDSASPGEAMGQFGKLTSVADLPDEAALATMLDNAIALAEGGAGTRRTPPGSKPALETPDDLAAALAAAGAAAAFAALSPGARREYVEWVEGAKQPATRAKRIATTATQVAEGKKLNWRYENC